MLPSAIEHLTRALGDDSFEGVGEAVRVALPACLAVGDDVEPEPVLLSDRHDGGVVVGLVEPRIVDPPERVVVDPDRDVPVEPGAIDQPARLAPTPDERGGQDRQRSGHGVLQ